MEPLTTNQKSKLTKEYIKVFQGRDNKQYYILITPQDNQNILLTSISTTKFREIRKCIQNAREIKARDSREVSSARSHNVSLIPQTDSATTPSKCKLLRTQEVGF